MSQIVRKKLQAGDLISTGTFFSPPVRPAPGQSYAVRYEGLLNLVELDQVTGGNDQDAWSVAVALAPIPVVGQVAILTYIATDAAQRIYHNLKK